MLNLMLYFFIVICAGAFDCKFVELYEDRNAGGTNPQSLYQKIKAGNNVMNDIDGSIISDVQCSCCDLYKVWKKKHSSAAEKLCKLTEKPFHYRVLPDKLVKLF